ncbi:hypothetical protein D3H55_00590 [Bacillus salacetis]|uniref:Uncharacterized protein n=1 Tax=Bacillus salacetis TaxID=2315464 RepID=A0A3A1R6N5_9BACI|nr:hypothetical protein D3H55_00590 [Bacillus salacetis]
MPDTGPHTLQSSYKYEGKWLILLLIKAVFAYIVAFGKILSAGFSPCIQRFYTRKTTSCSFLSCLPGILRRFTRIFLEIHIEYQQSLRKEP